MTPWWVPIVVALAALGGAGLGARAVVRAQRVAADANAAHEAENEQHAAAIRLLGGTYAVDDGAQVLQLVLLESATAELLPQHYDRYLQRWQLFVDAFAGVVLACPADVVRAAITLNQAVRALSDCTDAWHRAVVHGSDGSRSSYGPQWASLRDAVIEPRHAFVQATRRAFPFCAELDEATLTGTFLTDSEERPTSEPDQAVSVGSTGADEDCGRPSSSPQRGTRG